MSNQGKIVQIIGAVVDVEFARTDVPKIYDALKVDGTAITLEVQQQLGDGIVRTPDDAPDGAELVVMLAEGPISAVSRGEVAQEGAPEGRADRI